MAPAALLALGVVALAGVAVMARPRASASTGIPGIESRSTADLYGPFRERLDRLLGDLHAAGFRPSVRATWRSPERQAYYRAQGYSQVSRSFHEVTGPQSRREALAADVYDSRWGPDDPRQAPFYRALLARSQAHGLTTGGAWTASRWPGDPTGILGWDPGHVEPAPGAISIGAAHAGARPWT